MNKKNIKCYGKLYCDCYMCNKISDLDNLSLVIIWKVKDILMIQKALGIFATFLP